MCEAAACLFTFLIRWLLIFFLQKNESTFFVAATTGKRQVEGDLVEIVAYRMWLIDIETLRRLSKRIARKNILTQPNLTSHSLP